MSGRLLWLCRWLRQGYGQRKEERINEIKCCRWDFTFIRSFVQYLSCLNLVKMLSSVESTLNTYVLNIPLTFQSCDICYGAPQPCPRWLIDTNIRGSGRTWREERSRRFSGSRGRLPNIDWFREMNIIGFLGSVGRNQRMCQMSSPVRGSSSA